MAEDAKDGAGIEPFPGFLDGGRQGRAFIDAQIARGAIVEYKDISVGTCMEPVLQIEEDADALQGLAELFGDAAALPHRRMILVIIRWVEREQVGEAPEQYILHEKTTLLEYEWRL